MSQWATFVVLVALDELILGLYCLYFFVVSFLSLFQKVEEGHGSDGPAWVGLDLLCLVGLGLPLCLEI